MKAIILGAGYGTRLYPLTLNTPKALLRVGRQTILDRIIDKIESIKACSGVYLVTNDKFFPHFSDWERSRASSVSVAVINDGTVSNETRLGAIGDINLVLRKKGIDDDLCILGSDNLFEFDLDDFVTFGSSHIVSSAVALFDVRDKKLARKYGICSIDENSKIVEFEEKPQAPKSTLAASAIYYIPREKIKRFYEYMATDLPKDAPGNFIRWLAREDTVFGFVMPGAWYDIGDIQSLKKADEEFKNKEEKGK
jgi:glucose-1-phosphate thymidylyltransferase